MKQTKLEGMVSHTHEDAIQFLFEGSSAITFLGKLFSILNSLENPPEEYVRMATKVVSPQQCMLISLEGCSQVDLASLQALVESSKFGTGQDLQRMKRGLIYACYLKDKLQDISITLCIPDTEDLKAMISQCEFALSNFLYGFTNVVQIPDIVAWADQGESITLDQDVKVWSTKYGVNLLKLGRAYMQLRLKFIPTLEANLSFPDLWSKFMQLVPPELIEEVGSISDYILYPDIQAVILGKHMVDEEFIRCVASRNRESSVFSYNIDMVSSFALRVPDEYCDIFLKYGEMIPEQVMMDVIAGKRNIDRDLIRELNVLKEKSKLDALSTDAFAEYIK